MTEKLTETDLFKMKTLSQPVAATDRYFVTQTRVDQESNDYRANILGFTKAGEFVGNFDNDNYSSKSPVVGANFLFFLSKKTADSTYQVFKVPFAGGTATQVSHFNHAVESLKVAPGTDTVYFKTRETKEIPKKPYEKIPSVRHVYRLYHKADNFGFFPTDGTYLLYTYAVGDDAPNQVFTSQTDFNLTDASSDGPQVTLTQKNLPDDDLDFGQKVLLVNTQTGTEINVTKSHPDWTFINAKFSPDGSRLLLVGHSQEFEGNTQNYVYGYSFATKEFTDYTSQLDEESFEAVFSDFTQNLDATDIAWVSNTQFAFRTSWRGHSKLYLYENGESNCFFEQPLRITNWSVDGDQLVVTYSTPTLPVALATLSFAGQLNDLFNPNDSFDKVHSYVNPEAVSFKASDGLTIEGWLYNPLESSAKEPIVLDVHGGPHQAWTENFYFDIQLYANNGYGVLLLNPRGSKTYGQAFCQEVVGAYGKQDYTDLMTGLDFVLDLHPEFDRNRQYCIGASYGGFMATWAVGHTDRFAGAVAQKPVTDWISLAGTSDIGYSFIPQELKLSRYDVQKLWDCSPVAYAQNVKTPTLIIQGEWDVRTPIGQGEEFFTALLENGTKTEMSRHPQSWHAMSRLGLPNLRIERIRETRAWWDRN